MTPENESSRHFVGAYVLAAMELLAGIPLALATMSYAPLLFRGRAPNLDDYVALVGMAVPGLGVTVAGAATLFHSRLTSSLLRNMQLLAVGSEFVMVLSGVGILAVARHRGGDWGGLGILTGFVFIGPGMLLLLISLLGLRYLRRVRTGIT